MPARSLKRYALSVLGRCARSPLAWRLSSRFFTQGPNIVYYHGVWRPDDERLRLFGGLDLSTFRRHLLILRNRFAFVPLETLLEGDPGDDRLPLMALTFDDGFDLTSSGVTDVLDDLAIPATTFVNNASVNYRRLMWQHRFCAIRALRGETLFVEELNKLSKSTGIGKPIHTFSEQIAVTRLWPACRKEEYAKALWDASGMPPHDELLAQHRPYFDWQGLRDWMRRGHSVGLHTDTHPFCSGLAQHELEAELLQPGRELEAELDIRSPAFAYPFGDRLPSSLESSIASANAFSCLLGTAGFSSWQADRNSLERVEPERGIDFEVFGRPLARAMRGTARNGEIRRA